MPITLQKVKMRSFCSKKKFYWGQKRTNNLNLITTMPRKHSSTKKSRRNAWRRPRTWLATSWENSRRNRIERMTSSCRTIPIKTTLKTQIKWLDTVFPTIS
jgi:hypothetical protein